MPITAITAPSEVTAVDALLDAARTLVDGDVRGIAARPEFPISCGPGCGACCRQAVPVTAAELRAIRAWLDALPDDERLAHDRRIVATKARLDASDGEAIGMENERAYFALGIPCPFLVNESCSIHPARPLACREYVVTSDPAHCASRADGQIVRISARHDVLGAFANVSAAMGEPTEYLLAPAIARPVPQAPVMGPRPASAMMRMLMGHPVAGGTSSVS